MERLGRGADFDRRAIRQAPFRPGPVVNRHALLADQIQREGEGASRDPRAATRHDRLVERYPRAGEQGFQLIGAPELLSCWVGDLIERQVAAARDVAAATARPGFLGAAVEAAGGARIDDLFPVTA